MLDLDKVKVANPPLLANCEPLGNVLIIQEDNCCPEILDDNVDGGVITFFFSEPQHIKSIGLLDVHYESCLSSCLLSRGQ
jgi:hypothetical protein